MFLYPIPLWVLLLLLLLLPLLLPKRGNKHLPPGPPKLPIIGNLHQLAGLPHRSLWQLSKKYGPVMLLHFGGVPAVVISSAEAAEEVLKNHDLSCCSRPSLVGARRLSYNYLDLAFSPYGDYWREIRKICVHELFSIKRVQSFQFIRDEEVAALIDSISQSSSAATPVDLTEKFFSLTANITFRLAFGTSFEATDLEKDRFKNLLDDVEALLGSFSANEYFQHVGWIIDRFTGYYAKTENVFHKLDTFFQQIIDDHLKPGKMDKELEDIVDVLLRLEREQTEVGSVQLTKDHIKAVLMDLFVAGVYTGAVTLIWAMAELARNPEIMKNAQEEVRNVAGNRERVAESDIDDLHYLKMVIKETLRLHPPAPLLLPREVISNFKINGCDIYPKSLIHVNVWAIGRDPNYWKDPEDFFPERFIDSFIDFKGQHFELLPFGAGRRGCPALHMGTVLIELALANLLYCFDWKLPNGVQDINMEEQARPSLTISKMEPLKLVPVRYLAQ
ncbi:cytochrome P450 71B36 [Ricinus communis]|uniref:cytochrome P450 71B36 n=1 Tax=Ricinus communis TaxID=3988 RepID=UPI00201A6C34|nr:cytochrome P450 71B36 [Ricinus communis]